MKLNLDFPKKRINTIDELKKYLDTLQDLMFMHFDTKAISSSMLCDEVLLEEYASLTYGINFEELCESFKSRSNANLLNTQYEKALSGSEKLLIHLGKNYAKQVDDATKLNLVNAENVIFKENETLQDISNYKEDN